MPTLKAAVFIRLLFYFYFALVFLEFYVTIIVYKVLNFKEAVEMRDKYDVLIVGAGLSGLYAAYNLDSRINALVVCKRDLRLCNSNLAQGGVAAVMDTVNDSYDLHIKDTLIAGGNANRPEAVDVLVKEGPDDVRKMIELGTEFDKIDGEIHATLEGGHCRRRILHHRDTTGEELMRTIIKTVKALPNIDIVEEASLAFLDEANNGYYASLLKDGKLHTVAASYVIIATGGIGRVYKYTTNSSIATGDGISIAASLGAKIENLSYIQFHPTGFAGDKCRERFLISEAVRGEGAYLVNCHHERFMHRYDDRLELAPRDVVSRGIILESRRTGSDKFYLDITHRDPDFVRDRFPMIYERCLNENVDITRDLIPIFPTHHYLMGGIDVDLNSRTRINRLYAVGECSHTGVHGKNRLASNSLLEALVFGRRAAEDINRGFNDTSVCGAAPYHSVDGAPMPTGTRTSIRNIMQKCHFVLPNPEAARKYQPEVENIAARLKNNRFEITNDYLEARSLASIASMVLKEVIHK